MPSTPTSETKKTHTHLHSLDAKGFYSDSFKEEMLTAFLIRSPSPTGKLKNVSINDLPEGYYLFTAEDFPGIKTMEVNNQTTKIFGYGNISYKGEPIGIIAGPDEYVIQELLHKVNINFNIEDLEEAFNNVISGQKKNEDKTSSDLANFVSQINDMPSLDTVIDKTHSEENTETLLASRVIKTGVWKKSSDADVEKKIFSKADYVTTETWSLDLPAPSWQENSGAFCYTEGKKLHIYAPVKWTYLVIETVSKCLAIAPEQVFVHKTKSSGTVSRGLWRTAQICAQAALAAYLSKKPVKIMLNDQEQIAYSSIGVKTDFTYRAAVSKEGRIKAMDIQIDIDAGSYNPFSQEITDRLAISACNFYKPENVRINCKCHTSKNPPTSISIKNLESQAFFSIENHMQKISNETNLFPWEVRSINSTVEKSDFPFQIDFEELEQTFQKTIQSSDFNRKYAAFHMDAIDRVEKDSTPFFGLPLRGIGLSCAYNISSYYGDSCFSYDPKIQVTLTKENKVIIHSVTPSPVIAEIWKRTVNEIMDIKKENIIIDSQFTLEEIPETPEETFSSISIINEIIKKCCLDIQKKRFHQPLPISSQKNMGAAVRKGWNKEKFSGCPYGTSSFAVAAVEVELDSYTFSEKIKGIWITINCGELYDQNAAKSTIRLEIQQELARLVEGRVIPCDNYYINFVESKGKSGQIGDLVHNTLPAAFSTAMSLALDTQLTKVPFTEKLIYSLTKDQEVKKQENKFESIDIENITPEEKGEEK